MLSLTCLKPAWGSLKNTTFRPLGCWKARRLTNKTLSIKLMQTKCQLSRFAGGKNFFCFLSTLYSSYYNLKISGAEKVADVFRHRLPDCQVFGIVCGSFDIYSSFL
tara:strand:+ start:365 stop:682 length:318 start_codon:yes stop_codon:yes gene_type:complete